MTIKVYKELDSEWDCIQTIVGHTGQLISITIINNDYDTCGLDRQLSRQSLPKNQKVKKIMKV